MKAFIKGRWFPLVIAIVGILVIAFVMALFGWRITYAPELETSWECVSAIASVAGAVGTVAAVWFAIRVADKQNKIALFEKRYAVYDALRHCITFSNSMIDNTIDYSDLLSIQHMIIASFGYCAVIEAKTADALVKECTKYVLDVKEQLDSATFLFNCNADIYTRKIADELVWIIFPLFDSDTRKKHCQSYQKEVAKMEQELLPQIKKELSLRKRII